MEKVLCQKAVRKEELSRHSGCASRAIGQFLDGSTSCMVCGKPANRMVYHITDDATEVILFCECCYARERGAGGE